MDSRAVIGLAWLCAAQHCDLHPRGSRLDAWILSAQQHSPDTVPDSATLSRAGFSQHVAGHWEIDGGIITGDNLTTHLSDVPRAPLSLVSDRQAFPHRDLGLMEGCNDVTLCLSCLNHSLIYPFVSETPLSLSVTAARSSVG